MAAAMSENQIDDAEMARRLLKRDDSGFLAVEYVYNEGQKCNRTHNVSETLPRRRLPERSRKPRAEKK